MSTYRIQPRISNQECLQKKRIQFGFPAWWQPVTTSATTRSQHKVSQRLVQFPKKLTHEPRSHRFLEKDFVVSDPCADVLTLALSPDRSRQ
ncbi:hypothetical protein AAB988_28160 [Burkholderia contaminans]|uniref:hypothetical protein n=1 Tax=Burkholderia contaminans TaxID=488447 RepID=UPI0031174156